MALAPHTRVGPYEIIAPIGAGGMGEVYRALDTRLGRTVALKVLPESLVSDEERLLRFEVEARAIADLSHPNILAIFDFGREGSVVYAALELIEGMTLKAALAAGPLPARKAADYAGQIASGLAAAHARGVLHRDIKPANIMVTAAGLIKLVDFGLAKRVETAKGETTFIAGLTDPGKVLGTIGYMAPEQVRGAPLDERSDLFGVGVVLYEMLAGQPPGARLDRADALAAVLRDDPAPMAASVPTALQRIVMRCLEKAPGERYQSALDLAFSLEAFGGSGGSGVMNAASEAAPAPRRGISPLVAAGLTALALTASWVAERWWNPRLAPPAPTFSRVTFRRGTVFRGRFSGGGHSVVYDAAWEGAPLDVFETALGSRDARARGLAPAALLAVSPSGDIAVAQAPRAPLRSLRTGRLAVASASGLPRPLGNEASAADWTPDGRELVVARREGAEWRVEWPVGDAIYRSRKIIFDLRVSPLGDQVAWLERDAPDKTLVMISDRRGHARQVGETGTTPGGLAWAPGARELWFTASKSTTLNDLEVRATTTTDGRSRVVVSLPGGLRLLDIAADGRVLVSRSSESGELFVEENGTARALGWQSSSALKHLSDDGRYVLFSEDGPEGFDLFLRPTSGGPAVLLAAGLTWDQAQLSPDGTRVALRDKDRVRLIPVGPGNVVPVASKGQVVAWLPDNRRLVLWSLEERGGRPVIVSADAASQEHVVDTLQCAAAPVLSPGGTDLACVGGDGAVTVQGFGEASSHRVVPASELGNLIRWGGEGRTLLSAIPGALPPSILGLDLASGRVSVVRDVKLQDAAGVFRVLSLSMTPDRRVIAYSLLRQLDELYVYTGLR